MDKVYEKSGNAMYRTMKGVCEYERMINGGGVRLEEIFDSFEGGYKGFQDPTNPVHQYDGAWNDWKTNVGHFAEAIFAKAGLSVTVTPIPSADYPTPAKRPLNSRLDGAKLKADYGIDPPDWRVSLKSVIRELT